MGKYLLAHDIGTSGNKATLFAVEGKLIKSTTVTNCTPMQQWNVFYRLTKNTPLWKVTSSGALKYIRIITIMFTKI